MSSLKLTLALLQLFCVIVSAKKDGWMDMLSMEQERLKKDGYECPDQQLQKQDILSAYLQPKNVNKTLACLLKFVEDNTRDSFMWSVLGTALDKKGEDFSAQATLCFRQATKISGKYPSFIEDWHFIGPFVIGKTEFDGDPIESFGGIENVSRSRFDVLASFPSELVQHGKVKWIKVKQPGKNNAARLVPQVNWNELVISLGSMGISEWQGWLVGDFPLNKEALTIMVKCSGASVIFIDDVLYAGDVYFRDTFRFTVHLKQGVHRVMIKLRAKVEATFKCSFDPPPWDNFEVLKPTFLPDIYNGYLFSEYLVVPVTNFLTDRWLNVSSVYLPSYFVPGDNTSLVGMVMDDRPVYIAPGHTQLFKVEILSEKPRILDVCTGILFTMKLNTSEGTADILEMLRCRNKGDAFIFTFLDHDGSVQQAAAIEPRGSCPGGKCPVLLTLHGTTVAPLNQAESYKRMVDSKFQFGVEGMWVLAPTRHGAHNWEGPGALTAMRALTRLAELTEQHKWLNGAADPQHVLFEGHSMGGHGAWHLATHFPDRALGLVALASWITKEEYGDSNLFFKHDIATSHTDASVKAVMEACIGENNADRHVSNLWKIPILCRVGGNDRTVHPFFTRRMYRLLQEAQSKVTFTELEGREHWWWDTWETNDGGVMNDKQMRTFAANCLSDFYSQQKQQTSSEGSCSKDDEGCSDGKADDVSEQSQGDVITTTGEAELVVVNPGFGEGLRGVRILQQTIPFRTSRIKISVTEDTVTLVTSNVQRFTVSEPPNRPVNWHQKMIVVDGYTKFKKWRLEEVLKSDAAHFCKKNGMWTVCRDDVHIGRQRGPHTHGPARRVAEKPFLIVVGTQGTEEVRKRLQAFAVYIANLFYLTSEAVVSVVRDIELTDERKANFSLILVGSPEENNLTQTFLLRTPIQVDGSTFKLGHCRFTDTRMGVLTLAPHGTKNLALILMGTSVEGLQDVVSLATPTIPPMARSPFSNLVPDFVITGDNFRRHGPGGFLCAGFWGNRWELRQDAMSCACGIE